MKRYIHKNDYKLFRPSRGKYKGILKGNEPMRSAFGRCVGDLVAIPVKGHPDEATVQRYVIEVDITPHSYICKKTIFEYRDIFNIRKQERPVRYMRVGDANLIDDATEEKDGKNFGKKEFAKTVKTNAKLRGQADMVKKRGELKQEVERMESQETQLRNEVVLDRLRAMVTHVEGKIATGGALGEEEYELLEGQVKHGRDFLRSDDHMRSLDAIGEAAALAWPSAVRKRAITDLQCLAGHIKDLLLQTDA